MFDSTFSPIIAQFQDEEPIPYADDEPILPKEEIAQALDSREERYTGLLTTVGYNSTDQWWKKVEPALEKGDKEFINKNPWQLSANFQGLLQGLWNDTWDSGCFHAVKGLNIATQEAANEGSFNAHFEDYHFAKFADYPLPDYPQEPFYTPYNPEAYPPNYGYPLRNTDLQGAVEQRVLYLANDVNDKTRDRIQASVMNAVATHGAGGIPKRDRARLLQQINLALGRQSLSEIKDPDVAIGEKLVRTTLRVPGTQTFRSRAKTIAATEVSAAYSLGRLQVYTQAGVKRVRWQTLEDLRVCKLCRSRNGIVIELDVLLAQHQFAFKQQIDPTKLVIPVHPMDRCFWVPLVEGRKKDQNMVNDPGRSLENRQVEPLKGTWNALKNVLGVTVAIAGAAQAVQRGVEDIQRQQLQRQQEEERQKQEQARKLARAIMVTGGAALSLGVLYMIMQGQAQRVQQQGRQPGTQTGGVVPTQPVGPTPQPGGLGEQLMQQVSSDLDRAKAVEEVRSRPVLPSEILTEEEQQGVLAKLPPGLDLRTVSTSSLRNIYGLTIAEAQMVEELRKQYERDRATPPEQALIPQFFLPPDLLNQLPDLKQAGNLRDLTLQDLARMILRAKGEIVQSTGKGKRLPVPRPASTPSKEAIELAERLTARDYRDYLNRLNLTATNIQQALNKQAGTRYENMSDRERYLAVIKLLQRQRDYAHVVDVLYEKVYGTPGTFSTQVRQRQAEIMGQLRALYDSVPNLEVVERQAQRVQGTIERQVQNVLGLPPARIDGPPGELMVGDVNLNTATVEEIARLLPAGMSLARRRAIAQVIYTGLRRMSALGTPITNLEELAALPGVGKITVRNLQYNNYTQNLNNLLLQLGDKKAADAIAGILNIGPKMAEAIVREFRESGQFGKPGVDAVEDLLERLERRVDREGRLQLTEATKNRIRIRLSGRMYTMPIPPTQPVGGVQPQGVGGALPPAPPAQITGGVTPALPGTVQPQLPPGEVPPQQPLTTPPTTLGFPSRIQPTTPTNRVIVAPSAEDNQKQRRDDALNAYSEVLSQVTDYQRDITKAVNDSRMPKQGIFGGGLKLDKYKNQLFKSAQRSIDKATNLATGTEVNASALNQMVDSVERNLNDIESRLQDIDDPLADPLFKQNGQLMQEVRDKIQSSRSTIRQGLKIVADGLTIPDAMRGELVKRREELLGLKARSQAVINDVLGNQLRGRRNHLMQSLDSQISTISNLTPAQVGGYYGEMQQLIGRLNELKGRVGDADVSDVVTSIDGQIQAIDEVLQNTQNLKRPELVDYLTQVQGQFNELQGRLDNLPRTFDELAPGQQEGFVGAKAMRDRIKGTTLGLDRNVSALQRVIARSRKYLDDTLEQYNNTIAPMETPQGETVYERERRQGLEYAQNIINLSVQGIDEQLEVLRGLADPVTGMASILSQTKEVWALSDKLLPPAQGTRGQPYETPYGMPPPPSPTEREERSGWKNKKRLNDAVKQRREAINAAAIQITSNGLSASGFPLSHVQRIEYVINPESGSSRPLPEVVTLERLQVVERLLDELVATRNGASVEIQELANAVAADMEQLRQLDPVAYGEVLRSPTWATIRQVRVGAASQVEEYDARISALQGVRAILVADSQQPTVFEYKGQRLGSEAIKDRMNDVRREVGRLIARRRDELTPIWTKLAPLTTADSKGIEKVYKGERGPTAGEQEFINELSEAEQKTLRDAATTGALDAYRRRVRLLVKEVELDEKKKQLWGDPNNPEKIEKQQEPKTILKSLEQFNKKMRKEVGMKIVLIPDPLQGRMDYRKVDLFDESAPNYEAEPGFKEYKGQPGTPTDTDEEIARLYGVDPSVLNVQKARRDYVAQGLIDEFEELPWVKDTLGMLVDELTTTLNWRQYVAQVEEGEVPSQVPTNYIEVATAHTLIRARRLQVENEMEVVGFKRRQTLAAFSRSRTKRGAIAWKR